MNVVGAGMSSPFYHGVARLKFALIAGLIAISLNTGALKLADCFSIATAHGGLLRLLTSWFGLLMQRSGGSLQKPWHLLADPYFQVGFHFFIGMLMALGYAFAIEPWWRAKAWVKGLWYALVVWLLNAVVVLPLTGEGFAGTAHLGFIGVAWFAAAHTLYFLALALIFQRLMAGHVSRGRRPVATPK
ncbi:hypothetical protein ACFFJT_00850 [Dyella flava]|uniref:DUF1440 domain-containing protein n=1 Tax=Dyella flava TaxID=1920170 RepID=A0ABS2K227_9GAMM|nr:hypothetical protein [Dyella flava]MBM7124939.1 hypothetical protein [Dyella flava]GLQ49892.1 hypothetical protein GCM10010872_13410 [Dyella flava]